MDIEKNMKKALDQAKLAFESDEVPVGALIIGPNGDVLAKSHNLKESDHNPCGHAEILAIKAAADNVGSWRLSDCSLFVTLEPCMMCAGAIVQSRLKHVYFGASDPKSGFVESLAKGFEFPHNHKPSWTKGVLELECASILKKFFKLKRQRL